MQSLSQWLSIFRNTTHHDHLAARSHFLENVFVPKQNKKSDITFLTSQMDFIRGLDCNHQSLHLFRTESLRRGFVRLLTAYNPRSASVYVGHANQRNDSRVVRTHRAGGTPLARDASSMTARTFRQSSFLLSDASTRASASLRAMRATPSVTFWRASPPELGDDSSVVDARAVARVRSAESRRGDDSGSGVAARRGPRRAHRGCGSRDGPAVAPDAALCGSTRGVTVATRNAALMSAAPPNAYP